MMNKKEFLHLKSGTDVRGTAVETAEHGVQLTDETVLIGVDKKTVR